MTRLPRRSARLGSALVAALLLMSLACGRAIADGGVTADARSDGGAHAIAFVAPIAPRVGVIDVSVLLSPSPPPSLQGPLIRAVHLESGIERSAVAMPAHQGNRLLRSTVLEVPRPGRWRIEVAPLCDEARASNADDEPRWPSLSFEIEVAPGLPPWRSQWLWLFAWIPLSALLLWRDRLVATRGESRAARVDSPHRY